LRKGNFSEGFERATSVNLARARKLSEETIRRTSNGKLKKQGGNIINSFDLGNEVEG